MSYYDIPQAGAHLPRRAAAIAEVLPPGSRVLDLGCHDGSMARMLLDSGAAAHVHGFDREDVAGRPEGLDFTRADLRDLSCEHLPDADAVLFLNVAHHMLSDGKARVIAFLRRLLDRYKVVFFEMGSLTEGNGWPWRNLMSRLWPDEDTMLWELTGWARGRRRLLTLPFQGGRRVLWKLIGERETRYEYEVLETLRRNEASAPSRKRFLSEDDPGAYPNVCYHRLRRVGTGEEFWAKRYSGYRADPLRRAWERHLLHLARSLPAFCLLPWETHPVYGDVYAYEPEVRHGPVIHYSHRQRGWLTRAQISQFERLAASSASDGPLANLPVALLTDFQAVATEGGLAYLDFEPSHMYRQLLAPLWSCPPEESGPIRRDIVERLYHPRRIERPTLERVLDGATCGERNWLEWNLRRAQEQVSRAWSLRHPSPLWEAGRKLGWAPCLEALSATLRRRFWRKR